jgi:hypothetical protein
MSRHGRHLEGRQRAFVAVVALCALLLSLAPSLAAPMGACCSDGQCDRDCCRLARGEQGSASGCARSAAGHEGHGGHETARGHAAVPASGSSGPAGHHAGPAGHHATAPGRHPAGSSHAAATSSTTGSNHASGWQATALEAACSQACGVLGSTWTPTAHSPNSVAVAPARETSRNGALPRSGPPARAPSRCDAPRGPPA